MHIYDMERGTHEMCFMLSLICLTYIPSTIVMMACPEGFTLEEAIYLFENVHIKHQLEPRN